ncbi:hypothetical protein PVAG01_08859 [Phlyctema vagabunda]|uniref:Uncharacterized protein n=1 Tax=Phlyctema vagabunda TaxID=108571 RepID=A0ABR4PAP1_9HELO
MIMQFSHLCTLSLGVALVSAAPKPPQITFSLDKSGETLFSELKPQSGSNAQVDNCMPVCESVRIPCPPRFQAKNVDSICWTCCLDPENASNAAMTLGNPGESSIETSSTSPSPGLNALMEVCLLACFSEEPRCRDPSYAKQLGDCWTCCTKYGEDEDLSHLTKTLSAPAQSPLQKLTVALQSNHEAIADPCLLICMFEKPETCGENGYSKQFGNCWTCCIKLPEDDSLDIIAKALDASTKNSLQKLSTALQLRTETVEDPCLLICLSEKPETCGDNGYPKKFGGCWTCCIKLPGDEVVNSMFKALDSSTESSINKLGTALQMNSVTTNDACLLICMSEKPTCGPGMYSKQFGECWTCCVGRLRGKNTDSMTKSLKAPTMCSTLALDDSRRRLKSEACLRICLPEEPLCGGNSYPRQLGGCWTCCVETGESDLLSIGNFLQSATGSSTQESAKSMKQHLSSGHCVDACLRTKPPCPWGTESGGFEGCWTCWVFNDLSIKDIYQPLIASPEPAKSESSDVCWRVAFPIEQPCPDGWVSRQLGEIWTCCLDDSKNDDLKLLTLDKHTRDSNSGGPCWAANFPSEPACPEGWKSQKVGDGWTCCADLPDEEDLKVIVPSSQTHKHAALAPCLRICSSYPMKCPRNWERARLGDCWTCCSVDESATEDPSAANNIFKAASQKASDISVTISIEESAKDL